MKKLVSIVFALFYMVAVPASRAADTELCEATSQWLKKFSEARDNGVSIDAAKDVFLVSATGQSDSTKKIFLDAIDNIYVGRYKNWTPKQIKDTYYAVCIYR